MWRVRAGLLPSLFLLAAAAADALCPSSACITVGLDDTGQVWINGNLLSTTFSCSGHTNPSCVSVPLAYLNSSGSNVIALNVDNTNDGNFYESWQLDITNTDGSHTLVNSTDTGNIKMYYHCVATSWYTSGCQSNLVPANDSSSRTWYDPAYGNATSGNGWGAPTVVTYSGAYYCRGYGGSGVYVGGLSYEPNGGWTGVSTDPKAQVGEWLYFRHTFSLSCSATTPTSTFTRSKTATPSPSRTPSPLASSPTNTPTRTATLTNSPTPSGTPSFSPTPSNTPTKSPTSTYTNSPTPSGTPTTSPTPTWTPTFSPTPTYSNSPTQSSTPTQSFTFTASPTPSSTPTPTPTYTATPTFSDSPTPTGTPTHTPTYTPTPTNTPSPTYSNSPTQSFTFTGTNTYSGTTTFTNSPTPSCTPTQSFTFTGTPSFTNSPTLTSSSTPTATFSGTVTFTDSPTVSYSFTPTQSYSGTATYSDSPTPSQTNTESFTYTGTRTYSETPTMPDTATDSPTPTESDTYTGTRTPTEPPSATFTPSESASFTESMTPTGTRTATPTKSQSPTFSESPTESATFTISPTWTPQAAIRVDVKVYNSAGELVAVLYQNLGAYQMPTQLSTLQGSFSTDGGHGTLLLNGPDLTLVWDGSTMAGQKVKGGVYSVLVSAQDPFGTSKQWIAQMSVISEDSSVLVQVFNGAGELVWSESRPGALLTGLTLSRTKIYGDSGADGVKIVYGAGATDQVRWSGVNSKGLAVATGTYYVKVSRIESGGAKRSYTATVTVIQVTEEVFGRVLPSENPVSAGNMRVSFTLTDSGGVQKAWGSVYSLDGEKIGSISGPPNGLVWEIPSGLSSGICLVRITAENARGGTRTQTVKVCLLR